MRNSRLLSLLLFGTVLTLYFGLLSFKALCFVDVWPLEGVWFATSIVVAIVALTSWYAFPRSVASLVISSIVFATLVVFIPVLKYFNDFGLYGLWDSLAHYSFSKWIVEQGHVASHGELYYSDQYRFHPGNGMLPAVLNLVSAMPLTSSMNIIIVAGYVAYLLFICLLVKAFSVALNNMKRYLVILALMMFLCVFLPYYSGCSLSYPHVGLVLYLLILAVNGRFKRSDLLVNNVVYAGLLFTHLSTSTILAIYLVLITIPLALFFSKSTNRGSFNVWAISAINIFVIFLGYELYADVYLASLTIRGGWQRLTSLYIGELEVAEKVMSQRGLSLFDLLTYLISQSTKYVIILGCILVYLISNISGVFSKRKYAMQGKRILLFFLMISLPVWTIGWAGVGNFLSGGIRTMQLISFVFLSNIFYDFKVKNLEIHTGIIRKLIVVLILLLLMLGFITNYGLPLGPYIKSVEGDLYIHPVSQGAITPWCFSAVKFLECLLTDEYSFLILQPYVSFGLGDLLWYKHKIPKNGFIAPEIATHESMINIIQKYIGADVVIPVPLEDNVVPGPLGYKTLYQKPYRYLLNENESIVYSNGLYLLFITR